MHIDLSLLAHHAPPVMGITRPVCVAPGYTDRMDEQPQEATHAPQQEPHATHDDHPPLNEANASTADSAASGARAAIIDATIYNLTVPQAREHFLTYKRDVPAETHRSKLVPTKENRQPKTTRRRMADKRARPRRLHQIQA